MPYAEAEFITLKSKIKITYSKKQINKNYVHIPVSRNKTYSFLCNIDDAYGISSLKSLDVVQFRSISPGKEASYIHKENVRRNIQLEEAICEKQSLKENLKTNNGFFFLTKRADGLLFSYNIHDEE